MTRSVLELLHPDGVIDHAWVIGSKCPDRLRPTQERDPLTGAADLVVLAPTPDECQRPGWISGVLGDVARQLASDGFVYVLAPPRWRRVIARRLAQAGLMLDAPTLHLPNWSVSRYLVPIAAGPGEYAFGNLMPNSRWKRWLARASLRFSWVRTLICWTWPAAAFAARRPASRPLLDWLFRFDSNAHLGGGAVITTAWRPDEASVVLHRFSEGAHPTAVAKLVEPPSVETDMLGQLAPAAGAAGASVPAVLISGQLGDWPVFLESTVPGRTAATLLRAEPAHLAPVLACVSAWLEVWNLATRDAQRPIHQDLEGLLLGPAARLAPQLDNGHAYHSWLTSRCAQIDRALPLVAAHNDLTTWNVLFDAAGHLGVVDWEAARPQALPLVDFFYLATDAVVMAHGGPDQFERYRALEVSLAPSGAHARVIRPWLARLCEALGVPKGCVDLCLHATFIEHALNERRWARPGDPRPFHQLVNWLVSHRDQVFDWTSE
jgi:phosphotransferase family enzyme